MSHPHQHQAPPPPPPTAAVPKPQAVLTKSESGTSLAEEKDIFKDIYSVGELRSRNASTSVHSSSNHSPTTPEIERPVKKPAYFPPPVLRPQHVYAPVAPLGMLSLGVLSKHKNEFDRTDQRKLREPEGADVCTMLLTAFSLVLVLVTLPFSLCVSVKVVQEYERAVVFRLGRLRSGGAKGPGLFFIMPCVDTYKKVDLRTVSFDVPPQEVLSRDSVTVSVDAVVYYRVSNPTMATNNIEDYSHSTRLLAATTLRNVLGTKNLAEILSERETISQVMQNSLDEATDPWGVKAERVEIKDVRLPVQLQRAMAAEAEAAREARAKVIAAVGEQKASKALREAASVIAESPSALQLRYLQTLNSIAAEHNSTIIFPMPMNFVNQFLGRKSEEKIS
ncbi:band 7 protein AGAP004871-like [Tigriopus californicus]|uniref:band 7 protein AGAP004871-like n=1 Tax=Tigriopus californicus TaxID=6832 RepID=UPI0027DA7FA2|nr:band 7 protein AGAP004871-like [Tigriopus californicus]